MIYSFPYIALLLFFLLIAAFQLVINLEQKTAQRVNWLVFIAFVLFFGFRGYIGWDWTNYVPFFKETNPFPKFTFDPLQDDLGFNIFTSIVKKYSKDYQVYVLVNLLIDACLLHIFFKRYLPEKYYALAFSVYLVFFGFMLETDLMRNVKSILLFLLSLKYLENRSLIKFLLLNVVGVLFHWTSIIFFPLYFFLHKAVSLRTFLLVFVIGNIIFLTKVSYIKPILLYVAKILGGGYEWKINYYVTNNLNPKMIELSIGYFERIFTSVLIMLYYNKILIQSKSNVLFLNSFFIYMILSLYFSEVNIIVSRLAALFLFSYWILIPVIVDCSQKVFKPFLLLIVYTFILIKMNMLADNIFYKYDNILLGKTKSFEERYMVFKHNYKRLLHDK